jgi:four helix bundle protein
LKVRKLEAGAMSRDHRKLKAFELADKLVLETYAATRSFPADERFGLTSQMRRAAVSAPANIVEGCARRTQRDYIRFLDISLGSLRELGYYIDLSNRLGFLSDEIAKRIGELHDETSRVLAALIRSLNKDDSNSAQVVKPSSLKPQA